MKVKVLYFAALRDILGRGQETLTLAEGTTLASLLKHRFKDHPKAQELSRSLALAVNREFVKPSRVLKAGDEVGLLPPVSGG